MSEAIDLARPQPEPPTGGVPSAAGARKQSAAAKLPSYVQYGRTLFFIILYINNKY
jgi:hypothetical protein